MADDRQRLHELREQVGIQGNSKMDERELRRAIDAACKGGSPDKAKQPAKSA